MGSQLNSLCAQALDNKIAYQRVQEIFRHIGKAAAGIQIDGMEPKCASAHRRGIAKTDDLAGSVLNRTVPIAVVEIAPFDTEVDLRMIEEIAQRP